MRPIGWVHDFLGTREMRAMGNSSHIARVVVIQMPAVSGWWRINLPSPQYVWEPSDVDGTRGIEESHQLCRCGHSLFEETHGADGEELKMVRLRRYPCTVTWDVQSLGHLRDGSSTWEQHMGMLEELAVVRSHGRGTGWSKGQRIFYSKCNGDKREGKAMA